jgi:hypothetical protein
VAAKRAEANASARTLISKFESDQQSFRQSAGRILRVDRFNRGSNPQVGRNQLHWLETGRNPEIVRSSGTGAQAQPNAGSVNSNAFGFPPAEGGPLPRA